MSRQRASASAFDRRGRADGLQHAADAPLDRATTARLTAAWVLGAWWPRCALHQHVGLNPSALVGIELVFHAGTIVAAALLWARASRPAPAAAS